MGYILLIVLVNLGVGFALGCHLGRNCRREPDVERPLVDDGTMSLEGFFPSSAPAGKDSPPSKPSAAAPSPPAETPMEAEAEPEEDKSSNRISIEAMLRVVEGGRRALHDGRERYLSAVAGGDNGIIEACLVATGEDMRRYEAECAEANGTFETFHPKVDAFTAVHRRIGDALVQQARAIKKIATTLAAFDPDRIELSVQESQVALDEMIFAVNHLHDLLDEAILVLAETEGGFDPFVRGHGVDATTGLPSRLGLAIYLRDWWKKDPHRTRQLTLGAIDVDELSKINRRFGDAAGDRLLKRLAGVARDEVGTRGFVSRVSGTRFVLCATDEDADQIIRFLEQIRQTLETAEIRFGNETFHATVSCAVTDANAEDTLDSLLERLGVTIGAAKRTGRNRTFQHDGAKPTPVLPPNMTPRQLSIDLAAD